MSSSSRFLLDPAPGGLELVQDLVNTRPVAPYGVRDLLGTVADAQRFTTGAVRAWKEHSAATGGVRRITSADLSACDVSAATWNARSPSTDAEACSPSPRR